MTFWDWLSGATASDWFGLIGFLIGVIELFIGIYTVLKVHRVDKAQKEARQFTQDLLNIDRLEVDLVRVIDKFKSFSDCDSSMLASELSLQLGTIKGVRRALDESSKDKRRKSKKISSLVDSRNSITKRFRLLLIKMLKMPSGVSNCVIEIRTGFFGEQFNKENIHNAKTNIDIITGRTKLASGFYILDALRQACERGVQVRIIGLSADAPDAILQDATKTVSNPPPQDAADYKRQIEENMREIIENVSTWSLEAQHNFCYKVSKSVPRVAILRCDNIVNFGFLQFYRIAQPKEIADREYLSIPIGTSTGVVAMKHIEAVWGESNPVFPVPPTPPVSNLFS